MIKFEHKAGPFGDSTSLYNVETDANTVGELIDRILEGQDNDSYITVCIRGEKNDACVAYIRKEDGAYRLVRKCKDYDKYIGVTIAAIIASGGWGMMTFDITPAGEFPPQEREDFVATYFGRSDL